MFIHRVCAKFVVRCWTQTLHILVPCICIVCARRNKTKPANLHCLLSASCILRLSLSWGVILSCCKEDKDNTAFSARFASSLSLRYFCFNLILHRCKNNNLSWKITPAEIFLIYQTFVCSLHARLWYHKPYINNFPWALVPLPCQGKSLMNVLTLES